MLDESPDPNDWGRGPQPHEATRQSNDLEVATYYGFDALGHLETTGKTMTNAVLHRKADEQSPWLQCCHD